MTNYVTGKMPIVTPTDDMRIAVGGIYGSLKLSDLKSFITDGKNTSNKKRIAITSITIPDGTKAKVNTTTVVPVTINPIGGNDTIIIAELNISYMDSVQYSPEKRELTLVANSVGTSQIRFSWNSGQEYKDFFIPVEN